MAVSLDPKSVFDDAYGGRLTSAQMSEFHMRLLLREDVTKSQIDPIYVLNSTHREALTWLRANIPAEHIVFDIGTGPGYFVKALRKSGFRPMGLDVAQEPVRLLRSEGYQVWNGSVESIPADWPHPAVCTVFFVLHHVQDPIAFLRSIRIRFPDALLIVAQYNLFGRVMSPRRSWRPEWLPPRTLCFWGPRSLRKAMELAGYKVEVNFVSKTASDYEIPEIGPVYFLFRTALRRWLSAYYAAKPVLFKPLVLLDRHPGVPYSLLGIGRPL